MDAGLDRGERFVDAVGDFLLGESAEVEHLDHFALVGIQLHHSRADEFIFFTRTQALRWGACIHRLGILKADLILQTQAALERSQAIDCLVAGHCDQPSHGPATGNVIHGGFFPEHEEHLLGNILGIGFVVENPVRGRVDDADVASLEDGQCLRITCAHALDQVDIADFRKMIAHGATAYVVSSGMATLCGNSLWQLFVAALCGSSLWQFFVAALCRRGEVLIVFTNPACLAGNARARLGLDRDGRFGAGSQTALQAERLGLRCGWQLDLYLP